MPNLEMFLWCALGAGIAHFYALTKENTALKVLIHFKQSWAIHPFGVMFEALLLICIGSIIGNVFTSPCTAQQAIIAGVGWTGALALATGCKES